MGAGIMVWGIQELSAGKQVFGGLEVALGVLGLLQFQRNLRERETLRQRVLGRQRRIDAPVLADDCPYISLRRRVSFC